MDLIDSLIPNFGKFLQRHGKIEVLEHKADSKRVVLGKKREGKSYFIKLNGHFLGTLETYESPPSLFYDGKVPGFINWFGKEKIGLISYERENGRIARGDAW